MPHGVPSHAGPVLADDLPVWLTSVVCAVLLSCVASASGCSRSAGLEASTSAATPETCGDDIEVPWNQPKVAPSCWKHAKSAGLPIVRHMSPVLTVAPSCPQPP